MNSPNLVPPYGFGLPRAATQLRWSNRVGQGFQLVYQDGEKPVVRPFRTKLEWLLGRSMVCDVVFDSPHLSRKHAEISREPDGWSIQDLHSRQAVGGERPGG